MSEVIAHQGGLKVKKIPDSDTICRFIDFPRMYAHYLPLIWARIFPKTASNWSVTWCEPGYSDAEMHSLGFAWVVQVKKRLPSDDPEAQVMNYAGFVPALVGKVHGIRDENGNGFVVKHVPRVWNRAHAEIHWLYAPGQKLSMLEREMLITRLTDVFGILKQPNA